MKRNIFFLSMLAAGLLASSCSNDLDEGQEVAGGGGKPISFSVWKHKQLRSAATTTATISDFRLLAANNETDETLIDGLEVTGNGTHWTYSPLGLWPETAQVNFYAFSPAAANGVTKALAGQTGTSAGAPTISYTLPGHSVNTSLLLSSREDLLVAHHTGAFVTEGVSGVDLNFRHALSRVLFKAKSEGSQDFVVLGIALKNIKSSGKLNLASLPKDGATFAYPTTTATIANPEYQTYWDTSAGDNGDLVVDLGTGVSVKGDKYYDIVGDADALYVIPQKNPDISYLTKATDITGSSSFSTSQFYIEITYKESGQTNEEAVTYAVPVPAIVGDAYASSIAFEIERQYTFQLELFSHGLSGISAFTEGIDKY